MNQPSCHQLDAFTGLRWYWTGRCYDALLADGGWISLDMTSWDEYGYWRCHLSGGRAYWYGSTWEQAIRACLDGEGR